MRSLTVTLFLLVVPVSAVAQDHALTPGAVASTDPADVCGRLDGQTYSRRHRVWHDKRRTLARYGLSASAARSYEDDDRVPVCLGGDNADLKNHWPEPLNEARAKDRLESYACRAVCQAHLLPLTEAQDWFLGDWRAQLWRIER
jgi:hypothetical protein